MDQNIVVIPIHEIVRPRSENVPGFLLHKKCISVFKNNRFFFVTQIQCIDKYVCILATLDSLTITLNCVQD